MIYLYEEAIVNNLRTLLGDDRVSIIASDELFRLVADKKEDTVKLPLVSLQRIDYKFGNITGNTSLTKRGGKFVDNNGDLQQIQAIPIICRWQIDILSRYRKDNDNLTRELIFHYLNNPTLEVMLPYGIHRTHNFNIMYDPIIVDNSDVSNHVNLGEKFRTTLTITSDDAYLWKSTADTEKTLVIELSTNNGDVEELSE